MSEGVCFPNLSFFRYSFSIYLSYRLQADLLSTEEERVDTGSEHFRIYSNYTYYSPVTFIECLDSILESSPSSGVVAVRKYLERQINSMDLPVRFECIGPSPFHADFHLMRASEAKPQGSVFETDYQYRSGYDLVAVHTSELVQHQNIDEIKELLLDSIKDELGLFYDFMRDRSIKIHTWADIEDDLQNLLATDQKLLWYERVLTPVTRRKKLKKLFHDLLSFRANNVFLDSSQQEHYRSVYNSGKQEIFVKKYFDEYIENAYSYPTNEILEMIKFEEERTAKTFEWAAVLLAAILGGVVGSIVTLITK